METIPVESELENFSDMPIQQAGITECYENKYEVTFADKTQDIIVAYSASDVYKQAPNKDIIKIRKILKFENVILDNELISANNVAHTPQAENQSQ